MRMRRMSRWAAIALAATVGCSSSGADGIDTSSQASQKAPSGRGHGPACTPHGDDDCSDRNDGYGDHCTTHGGGDCNTPATPPPSDAGTTCGSDGGTSSDGGTTPPPTCAFNDYNQGLIGGQIGDVVYDPRTPGVAWAGAGPRLFKSVDHGATWSLVYEGTAFSFGKLALPSDDAQVLVAASSDGFVRSEDGGVTWTVRSLSGLYLSALLVHPAQPLRVYAAVRGAGILRSFDGGVTWAAADYGVPYADFTSMATEPSDPDVVLVGAQALDGVGTATRGVILKTTDAGASWTELKSDVNGVGEIAVCPTDSNILYANFGWSGLAKTIDRGATWTTAPGLAGKVVTDVAIAPTDCNVVYAVDYDHGLRRSSDGGATFSAMLTVGIPFGNKFPRHTAVDPAAPTRILGASQGGLLYSDDAGDHFSVVGGVMNLAIRSLGVSPTNPERLWMATWGSGLWMRPDASNSWGGVTSYDYVINVTPDPVVANRTFVGTWSYPFVTSDGTNFTMASVPDNPTGFAFDPAAPDTVYMTTQIAGLFKSIDGGLTYAASNGGLAAWPTDNGTFIDMRAVLVDRTSPNRIVIGTNGKGIYVSNDGGSTLVPVGGAAGLDSSLVSCLVQSSDGSIYACVSGNGIAKSVDGGATFTLVDTGLPSLNVAGLAADGNTLYSTSNLGVFVSNDSGGSWTALDTTCLPAGGAGMLTVMGSGATKRLVVGTGRGLFTHPL